MPRMSTDQLDDGWEVAANHGLSPGLASQPVVSDISSVRLDHHRTLAALLRPSSRYR